MASRKKSIAQDNQRLFIGVRPDSDTQQFLDGLVSHAKRTLGAGRSSPIRWTSHTNRHLTLAFLGETSADLVAEIEQRMQVIASELQRCTGRIAALHPFPQRKSRLLVAELLGNPDLDRLHRRCRQLMMDIGLKPESAVFRPHITLARSPRGFAAMKAQAVDFSVNIGNLVLYESLMAPGGSQYLPLIELPLCTSEQPGDQTDLSPLV
ncbi:RNA 2',3'-cyclic phosphodiesterase [Microbulbifer discodermiae]|uniref:RNA 2',3'-cyclic phosphodiesterase n=1 Tax=Microbulbifer sp. 2201CG32-9 TaxID=3232309 RepID=UPI00345C3690